MKKSAKKKRSTSKRVKALARVQFPVSALKRNRIMESKKEKMLKKLSKLEEEE
jgi:hypothetical protein